MPNDLQLSDQDEVLLESLVLAASDNVARAPASDRDQYAPERRRAFVETSGAGNVYLGTGSAWVDVSENTGLLSKLFSGGDGNFDSVNTSQVVPDFPSGARGSYEFVGTLVDDDFTTTLDAELTAIGDYDILEIHYAMRPSGTGFDQVFGRINGLSDSNYRFDTTTGATEWRIGSVNNASPTTGVIQITGTDFDNAVNIEPYFWTEGSSNEGEDHAGRYTADIPSIDSVRLFTNTENAGMRAHVRGMTL